MHIQDTNVLNPGRDYPSTSLVRRSAERGWGGKRARLCDYKDAAFYYFSYRQPGGICNGGVVVQGEGGGGGGGEEKEGKGESGGREDNENNGHDGEKAERARRVRD